ncbi:hypothetical protein DESC_580079 [Desulfosarcina cetonica]|nr:hypothetical protein DESC_580079 [Desulfosarcina cetonica]
MLGGQHLSGAAVLAGPDHQSDRGRTAQPADICRHVSVNTRASGTIGLRRGPNERKTELVFVHPPGGIVAELPAGAPDAG